MGMLAAYAASIPTALYMRRSMRPRSCLIEQNRALRRKVAALETQLCAVRGRAAHSGAGSLTHHDVLELQSRQLAAGTRMAALIAHEMNTPLQTIANYVYLLNNGAPATPSVGALQAIEHEVERMARVVQRLLTFQFADTAEPTPVSLPALLDRVLLLIGNQFYRRRIAIERRFGAELPRPVVYERNLTLVLLNLLRYIVATTTTGGMLVLSADEVPSSAGPHSRLLQIAIEFVSNTVPNNGGAEPIFTDFHALEPHLLLAICHDLLAEQGGSLHLWEDSSGAQKAVLALPIDAPAPEQQAV